MNRRPDPGVGLVLVSVGIALVAGITWAGTASAAGTRAAGAVSAGTAADRSRGTEIEPPDPLSTSLTETAAPSSGSMLPSSGPPPTVNAPASSVAPDLPVSQSIEEAERAYRAKQWSRAMDLYKAIVARAPEQRLAWLRIGNLHHQRRQYASAASAYRRASARAAGDDAGGDGPAESDRADGGRVETGGADRSIRNKALVNLALVNLEFARLALDDLRDPTPAVATARDDVVRELDAIEARARARAKGEAVEGPARRLERGGAVGGRPSVEYLRGAPSP